MLRLHVIRFAPFPPSTRRALAARPLFTQSTRHAMFSSFGWSSTTYASPDAREGAAAPSAAAAAPGATATTWGTSRASAARPAATASDSSVPSTSAAGVDDADDEWDATYEDEEEYEEDGDWEEVFDDRGTAEQSPAVDESFLAAIGRVVDSLRAEGESDALIASRLGFGRGAGAQQVADVLAGRSANVAARFERLLNSLVQSAAGAHTAATAAPRRPRARGAAPTRNAEIAAEVERLRAANWSDAEITVQAGYSGKSGPRDVEAMLSGRAKDLPAKLALLRQAGATPTSRAASAPAHARPAAAAPSVPAPAVPAPTHTRPPAAAPSVPAPAVPAPTHTRPAASTPTSAVPSAPTPTPATTRATAPAQAGATAAAAAAAATTTAPVEVQIAAEIARLRAANWSDTAISKQAGYAGKNGPRDVEAMLGGGAKDLAAKLALLRAAR
jgi:hypothetical protein